MNLKVEIQPFHDFGTETIRLNIRVESDGKRFENQKIESKDILRSHFDIIFDAAKHEIKEFLAKELSVN